MLELPAKSSKVWNKFFKENKPLVYRYIVREIKNAIKHQLPKIELFKFGDSSTITIIDQSNYIFMLNESIKVFVEVEDYERAGNVKKFLDQYHIDKLIKDSNEV